jgi:hypothetical protein
MLDSVFVGIVVRYATGLRQSITFVFIALMCVFYTSGAATGQNV